MKILRNVRKAPARKMVVAKPTVLRGGALETESPRHYRNLPAGSSSPFSSSSKNTGRRVVQTLPHHCLAGRGTKLGRHRTTLEGGAGSREPDCLEVLWRGNRGAAGSARRQWRPKGGRELSVGPPAAVGVGSDRLWLGAQQLESGIARPGDGQANRGPGEPIHPRQLSENLACSVGTDAGPSPVPVAKSAPTAASARNPNDTLDPETGRGGILRRRSGYRSQSSDRPGLDPAGATALGSHSRSKRKALPRRSPEPSHRTSGLGRGRPEAELALPELAARLVATLSSHPGASPDPRQLHNPPQQDRPGSAHRMGWSTSAALPASLLSRRKPHRTPVAPASRERDPKPPVPNYPPTSGQGPALPSKRNTVPRELPLPGESKTLMMFQNR